MFVIELDVIKQELESKLGSEFQNKLQRARSLSESTSESEQATGTHYIIIITHTQIYVCVCVYKQNN